MRNAKKLAALTAMAPTVAFPQKADDDFHVFRSGLRAVALENLGTDARGLEWDPFEQLFTVKVTESTTVGGIRGMFEATFYLNPKDPLLAEFERLQAEILTFRRACNKADKADA